MGQVVKETLPVVDAVAATMDERGISARQAATELGVSNGTVSNWLKANTNPPLDADTQAALARFLDVSPRRVVELFGIDLSDDPLDSGAAHTGPYLALAA